jgi:hypothetical protein
MLKIKKYIYAFLAALILFSCKTIIPKKTDNKASCLIIQVVYAVGNSYGVTPTKIGINIFNDEISNEYELGVNNKLYINEIKNGLYNKIRVYPIFSSNYYIDASMDYYKKNLPIALKINENSLIILPFKIIIKNENMIIKIIRENFDSNEIVKILNEVKKCENFNNYSKIYLGNKNING